jgi:photosystem II stability/assembly factor-like uncharacterized protein
MSFRITSAIALSVAISWAVIPASARAEWERQRMNAQDQDKAFLDVSAVSSSFAVAAGMIKQGSSDAAAVFITRDGMSWSNSSPQTSGGPMDLHIYMSVWFADESRGYVGGLGEIWVTSDGGLSWTRVGLGGLMGGRSINDIAGLRPGGQAWAVTSTGQVLATTDDGASWPEQALPLGGVNLNRVVFVDEQHGWVCSGSAVTDEASGETLGYEGGGLAFTTDGGATWQVAFSGESRRVASIRFSGARRGWMLSQSMSGSMLERTADGGLTWETVALPTESTAGALNGFQDVFFFSGCEGLLIGAVGGNDWGAIWTTRDGGATWVEGDREFLRLGQLMGFPVEAGLVTFDFTDRNVGWATGTNETIFRYDADLDAPECSDGGGGDGDGGGDEGGGRCGCRAPGAAQGQGSWAGLVSLLLACWLWCRRQGR